MPDSFPHVLFSGLASSIPILGSTYLPHVGVPAWEAAHESHGFLGLVDPQDDSFIQGPLGGVGGDVVL